MSFKAEIIADSICNGYRITSMLVTFPRIILAEFNTHRMLSRNSASSRAIPFEKMAEMVYNNPFIPLKWLKNHKGMQGTESIEEHPIPIRDRQWLHACDKALVSAWELYKDWENVDGKVSGVTKQICNRLLEPFMWHTVLVTATEWENFFALRADPAAEIHMQEIARLMLEAMNNHTPQTLKPGEWHMPYGDEIIDDKVIAMTQPEEVGNLWDDIVLPKFLKIATARCARVSYTTLDGKPEMHNYQKDIELHDRLAAAGHWSPFEHCARAMNDTEYIQWNIQRGIEIAPPEGSVHTLEGTQYGWCGNFRGWIQYRKIFANENRQDPRLIKK